MAEDGRIAGSPLRETVRQRRRSCAPLQGGLQAGGVTPEEARSREDPKEGPQPADPLRKKRRLSCPPPQREGHETSLPAKKRRKAGAAAVVSLLGRVASGRECYARETLRRKAVESLQVVYRGSLRRPLFTFLIKNLKS